MGSVKSFALLSRLLSLRLSSQSSDETGVNGWTGVSLSLPAIEEATAKGVGLAESAGKEALLSLTRLARRAVKRRERWGVSGRPQRPVP